MIPIQLALAFLSVSTPPATEISGAGTSYRAHSIPWPWELHGETNLDRLAAGDVTGDLVGDVVVLWDQTPVLVSGPGRHGGASQLDTTANDLEVFPHPSGPSASDVLATVGPTGLSLWTFDAASAKWRLESVDPSLAGARRVRCGVGSTGSRVLFVLEADGHGVEVVEVFDGVSLGSLHTASVAIPQIGGLGAEDARELELVDWDGDGLSELALLTANHLLVVGRDGVLMADHVSLFANSPMSIAVLADLADSRERLAWITVGIFQTQWILISDQDGLEGPYDLGTWAASAPVAGDYDGDGDSELFLTPESEEEVRMLYNFSEWPIVGVPTFIVAPRFFLQFPLVKSATPGPDRTDRPLVCDLDNDGDLDVLTIDKQLAEIRVVRGDAVDETRLVYRVSGGSFTGGCDGEAGELRLSLKRPEDPVPATTLEVTLWQMLDRELGFEREPVSVAFLTLPAQDSLKELVLEIPESGTHFDTIFAVELRLLGTELQTGAPRAWPSHTLAFTVTEDGLLAVPLDPRLGGELELSVDGCPGPVLAVPPVSFPRGVLPNGAQFLGTQYTGGAFLEGGIQYGKAIEGSRVAPMPIVMPFREGAVPIE